ncbi:hypothetical protein O6H91_01G163700 [Diphasiastrum complanatum]|nr:hypothetical protein O6H91_01G162300 [Diphasiastrum complanatum]KAJ7571456.1 hypothetical protein O6H91_01G163700 [Diphasiastrum complanatum]
MQPQAGRKSHCRILQNKPVDPKLPSHMRRLYFQPPKDRLLLNFCSNTSSSSTQELASTDMASIQRNIFESETQNSLQDFSECDENVNRESELDTSEGCAPLVRALTACAMQNAAAFHFPGHRRGAAAPCSLSSRIGKAPFAFDLPELPELDNLHAPLGAIADAQRRAAVAFGADATWFLVNGSTCGIHAAVMATCKPGDYLILPRNCHMSAVSAMVLSGTLAKYVKPLHDRIWGIAHGVSRHDIDTAIREVRSAGGRIGAVLIVSPTYFGVCSSVKEISALVHEYDLPLIVDEAHGGHFIFHPELPETALQQGADIAVQSTHKVLCSLTQSAMLHVKGERVCRDRISQSLRSLQSSSPSYLLLASLDAATAQMSSEGKALIHKCLECAIFARNCLKLISGLDVLESTTIDGGIKESTRLLDPLRITVGFRHLSITGFEADDLLRADYNVVAELPSLHSLTFAFTPGVDKGDVDRMIKGLETLAARYPVKVLPNSMCPADIDPNSNIWENITVITPRDAFFAPIEKISSSEAIGRVCAESICPYPPGIPIIAPGEIVTEKAISFLKQAMKAGATISGSADPYLSFISVCKFEATP